MRRSPLLSAALLVSTFALLTCLPAVAGRNKTGNSPEIRMSAGGRLAAHVRKALNQAGVRSFSSARVGAAGESNNCVNTSDDCEDGFSEGAVGGQAETSIAVDKSGQHIVVGFNDTPRLQQRSFVDLRLHVFR